MATDEDITQYEIDYAANEIFETSDHESVESDASTASDFSRRSSIEIIENNPEMSRQTFETAIVSTCKTNFSDGIAENGTRYYESYKMKETSDQRLMRIKKELEELEILNQREFNSEVDSAEVEGLKEKVNSLLKISPGGDKPKVIDEDIRTVSHSTSPTNDLSIPLREITDLTTRLEKLENTLGFSSSYEEAENFSVQASINDLYRKMNILTNPEYVKTEVRPVIEQLKKGAAHKTTVAVEEAEANDHSTDIKIRRLHNKLSKLSDFEHYIPLLTSKLKTVQSLNVQLRENVTTASNYQEQISSTENSFAEWQDWLKREEAKLVEIEKRSAQNREEVSEWVRNLEDQVRKIQS